MRHRSFLASVVLLSALALAPPGCTATDEQVKQTSAQVQTRVDELQHQVDGLNAVLAPTTQALAASQIQLDALRPLATTNPALAAQVDAGQKGIDQARATATRLQGAIDTANTSLTAATAVLQQLQDHPDKPPDFGPLAAVTSPIPYSGLFWGGMTVAAWLVQELRKGKLANALVKTQQDLDDHQTALAEIVPAVDDMKKALTPEQLSLWKDQVRADYSTATKALVAENKG